MENEKLFNESIILIGPSGAGKSTVGKKLSMITHMPQLCLDIIANRDRMTGVMEQFNNSDEYNYYMIKTQLEIAEKNGIPGIVDFGAGHSVYDDENIFNNVKKLLEKFKNIVLLLPCYDLEKSLQILARRSTGDYSPNRKFITSPCNRELATITVYENARNPDEIVSEILKKIEKDNINKEELDER